MNGHSVVKTPPAHPVARLLPPTRATRFSARPPTRSCTRAGGALFLALKVDCALQAKNSCALRGMA